MRVTYLAHSGFLVELPSVTLLLDWWKGALPPLMILCLCYSASTLAMWAIRSTTLLL